MGAGTPISPPPERGPSLTRARGVHTASFLASQMVVHVLSTHPADTRPWSLGLNCPHRQVEKKPTHLKDNCFLIV